MPHRSFGPFVPDFMLNIEANHATLAGHSFSHELQVAADAGLLGSIDANRGDPQNGWDTDEFPTDLYQATEAMMIVLQAGGVTRGGLNFDAKVRRNSTDPEDLFLAHIGGMDTFARGLEIAAKLLDESPLKDLKARRYASFTEGDGLRIQPGRSHARRPGGARRAARASAAHQRKAGAHRERHQPVPLAARGQS